MPPAPVTGTTLAQHYLPRTQVKLAPVVRDGLLIVVGTLLLAAGARLSIPLPWTPVPITLQTFCVLVIGGVYGPRLAALTMVGYLVEGLAGLPVFAFGRSAWTASSIVGVPIIIGPTAGYLFSYCFAAGLVGLLAIRGWHRTLGRSILAMVLGNIVILVCGFLWFAGQTWMMTGAVHIPLLFIATILPFLPGDLLKLLLAALIVTSGWKLKSE